MEIPNNLDSFRKELERKGYRNNSIENYTSYCSVFLNKYNDRKCPKHISESDIKDFLRGFTEHNTQRAYHSAIKAFYKYVVKQPNKFKYIEYCKRSRKLPIVLSSQEMKAIIDAASVGKRVYPHLIRHSSFTNMLESGVDISIIGKIAGHESEKTTRLYTHISSSLISKVYNPLQCL